MGNVYSIYTDKENQEGAGGRDQAHKKQLSF